MREIIKLYQTPEVSDSILQNFFLKKAKKENKILFLLQIISIWIFILFLNNLFFITTSYFDIFLWLSLNINFTFSIFVNLFIAIIYFIIKNIFLISISFIVIYFMLIFWWFQKNNEVVIATKKNLSF